MTATDFYSELTQYGVNVWLDGGALKYRAPQDVMTPALLADLKAHKAELIALLASNDAAFTLDRYRHLVQCQQCANLTPGGGCRMKAGYKPIPDTKRDCGQFEPVQGERQAIADTPYTAAELNDLLALSRLAKHQNTTQRAILEALILAADEAMTKDMDIESEQWKTYHVTQ